MKEPRRKQEGWFCTKCGTEMKKHPRRGHAPYIPPRRALTGKGGKVAELG